VTLGGTTKNINFIAIHAKANTGTPAEQVEAYQRRKLGSQALKDTLDANFANANIIFLGDFNDDFDRTIAPTTGADTVSSYQNFIIDSTDANSYISPTLPLSLNGASSTASFPNVIDHVIISNELKPALLSNSAAIRNDVASLVTNYANSTSDHYPVLTRYLIQNNEVPLPVRLVNFTAAKQSESVQVKWSTATEENTDKFIVERSSNGASFTSIGTVKAAGSTTTGNSYTFPDLSPLSGNNYYRLKIIDKDGSIELSHVVRINFSKTNFSIIPNPAKDKFVIITSINQPMALQVVDLAGKIIKTHTLTNQTTQVSVSGLAKGLYLVKLFTPTEIITRKLVVD
jgi:hypothetical protein